MASLRSRYTLLIPTFNRPAHLRSLLGYLSARRLEYPIRVLDSSSGEALSRNRETVSRTALDVVHDIYDAAIPVHKKIGLGVASVESTYCSLCADDDVLFTDELNALLDILDADPPLGHCAWLLRQLQTRRGFRHLVHGLLGAIDRCRRRIETNCRTDERLPGDLLWNSSHRHDAGHPTPGRPRQIALGERAADLHSRLDRRWDVPGPALLHGTKYESIDRDRRMAPTSILCHGTNRAFSRICRLSCRGTRAFDSRCALSSDLPTGADASRFRSGPSEISCANAVSGRHELSDPAISTSANDVAADYRRHMEYFRASICAASGRAQAPLGSDAGVMRRSNASKAFRHFR